MIEPPDRYCAPMWGAQHPRRAIVWPWMLWAVAITFAIGLVTCASQAHAQVTFDCQELAITIGAAADFRDAGADLDKTIAIIKERTEGTPPQQDVLEREIRKVWAEKQKRFAVMSRLYKRCRQQLGDMGHNS